MFVAAIGIAVPDHRYTKSDCWDAFAKSSWFDRLSPRSRTMTRAVLQRDNGIEARFLAVDSLDEVFAIDPDTLQKRFSIHAPKLADAAGTQALSRAVDSATKECSTSGGRANW